MISHIAFASFVLSASSLAVAQSAPSATPISTPAVSAPAGATSKEGSRLEELFIWKASEELRLQPEQESKFADTIRDLNARRRKATDALETTIAALANVKSKAESEKLIAIYRNQLRDVHAVQLAEFDQVKKVIGPEKLAKYLVVKNNLTDKLKSLISSPQAQK